MHKVGRPNLSEKVKLIWYCVTATLKPQMSPRHSIIVVRGNYWSLTILKIVLVERMLLHGFHVNRSCAIITLGRVLTFSITIKNVWSLNPQIMGVFLGGVHVLRCTTLGEWFSTFERKILPSCTGAKRPSGYFPWGLFSLEDVSTMLLGRSGVTHPRTRRHVPEDLNTHRCENLLKQHLFLIGRREKSYSTSGPAKETIKNSKFLACSYFLCESESTQHTCVRNYTRFIS